MKELTIEEQANKEAIDYKTVYSEDFRFDEVMKDPLRFDQDYPKMLYLLLKEKHYRDGFTDGAKWGAEHAVEWHDLRKDPNDLPKGEEVLKEYLVAYQNFNNPNEIVVGCFAWNGLRFLENYDYSEIPYFENKNVLYAWCELPHLKE